MNRLEKNREPEVVFVSEKKQKEYPHRPRKEIDMDRKRSIGGTLVDLLIFLDN